MMTPDVSGAAKCARRAAEQFNDECIRVLVVGAATGTNDLATIQTHVLPVLTEHNGGKPMPIEILLVDRPGNDFNSLVAECSRVEAAIARSRAPGLVSISAKIGCAQERLARDSSIHMVLCLSVLHWRGETKAGVEETATGRLAAFFRHRAAELRSGGQIVACFDGSRPGTSHQFARVYNTLRLALHGADYDETDPARTMWRPATDAIQRAEVKQALVGVDLVEVNLTIADVPCPLLLDWSKTKDSSLFGSRVADAALAFARPLLESSIVGAGAAHGFVRDGGDEEGADGCRSKALFWETLWNRVSCIAKGAPRSSHTGGDVVFLRVAKVGTAPASLPRYAK